jgi:hypothetical protein
VKIVGFGAKDSGKGVRSSGTGDPSRTAYICVLVSRNGEGKDLWGSVSKEQIQKLKRKLHVQATTSA